MALQRLALGFFACSLLLGCPGRPDVSRPQRLVLANVHGEGHPTAEALRLMAADLAVDPGLGGRFQLDLQLGGVLTLPYLFRDRDHRYGEWVDRLQGVGAAAPRANRPGTSRPAP